MSNYIFNQTKNDSIYNTIKNDSIYNTTKNYNLVAIYNSYNDRIDDLYINTIKAMQILSGDSRQWDPKSVDSIAEFNMALNNSGSSIDSTNIDNLQNTAQGCAQIFLKVSQTNKQGIFSSIRGGEQSYLLSNVSMKSYVFEELFDEKDKETIMKCISKDNFQQATISYQGGRSFSLRFFDNGDSTSTTNIRVKDTLPKEAIKISSKGSNIEDFIEGAKTFLSKDRQKKISAIKKIALLNLTEEEALKKALQDVIDSFESLSTKKKRKGVQITSVQLEPFDEKNAKKAPIGNVYSSDKDEKISLDLIRQRIDEYLKNNNIGYPDTNGNSGIDSYNYTEGCYQLIYYKNKWFNPGSGKKDDILNKIIDRTYLALIQSIKNSSLSFVSPYIDTKKMGWNLLRDELKSDKSVIDTFTGCGTGKIYNGKMNKNNRSSDDGELAKKIKDRYPDSQITIMPTFHGYGLESIGNAILKIANKKIDSIDTQGADRYGWGLDSQGEEIQNGKTGIEQYLLGKQRAVDNVIHADGMEIGIQAKSKSEDDNLYKGDYPFFNSTSLLYCYTPEQLYDIQSYIIQEFVKNNSYKPSSDTNTNFINAIDAGYLGATRIWIPSEQNAAGINIFFNINGVIIPSLFLIKTKNRFTIKDEANYTSVNNILSNSKNEESKNWSIEYEGLRRFNIISSKINELSSKK